MSGQRAAPAAIARTATALGSIARTATALGSIARTATALGSIALLIAAPLIVGEYTTSVLTRVIILALASVSVALMTVDAGLPTLGQTGPYAAGAYAAALACTHGHPSVAVGLCAGVAAGAGFAVLTAPLVIYARGAVVLMVTLALSELTVTAAGRWKTVTGGTDGLIGIPASEPFPGLPPIATDRARYWYVLVVVAVVTAVVVAAMRTPLGLLLHATRDNEARMRASGHRITTYLLMAYAAAGAIAGIAGSLLCSTQQYLSPADFGFDTAAVLLLAVAIGAVAPRGCNAIVGTLAGAGLVFWTRDWLAGVFPGNGPLLLGALFLVAGLLGGRHATLAHR